MRPYFPTEVEGKDVSSKLMVMVGVYLCLHVQDTGDKTNLCHFKFLKYPIIVP